MDAKQELLAHLYQVISAHLGVQVESINEKSTWAQLGADSLDRLELSQAIEDKFNVDIPYRVGEHLNTVGETLQFLFTEMPEQSKRTPMAVADAYISVGGGRSRFRVENLMGLLANLLDLRRRER